MTEIAAPARRVVASTPYPWPYHGDLDPSALALVACLDARFRPRGASGDAADARLRELAVAIAAAGGLVVTVAATPPRRGGERSPAFAFSLELPSDHLLEAGGMSAFFASRLDATLRGNGRVDLVIAGWGLEGPLHSTLRAANDRGYECLLVPDASVACDSSLVDAATSIVCFSGGIFGAVATTAATLDTLRRFEGQRKFIRATPDPKEEP